MAAPNITIDYSEGAFIKMLLNNTTPPHITISNVPAAGTESAVVTFQLENNTSAPLGLPTWTSTTIVDRPTTTIPANNGVVQIQLTSMNGGSEWFGVVNTFDGSGSFLPLTGGTMTGALMLAASPTHPSHAVNKQYVDDIVASSTLTAGTGVQITNGTIGLTNIGTAGTYDTVTVNSSGQVTSGSFLPKVITSTSEPSVSNYPLGGEGVIWINNNTHTVFVYRNGVWDAIAFQSDPFSLGDIDAGQF